MNIFVFFCVFSISEKEYALPRAKMLQMISLGAFPRIPLVFCAVFRIMWVDRQSMTANFGDFILQRDFVRIPLRIREEWLCGKA